MAFTNGNGIWFGTGVNYPYTMFLKDGKVSIGGTFPPTESSASFNVTGNARVSGPLNVGSIVFPDGTSIVSAQGISGGLIGWSLDAQNKLYYNTAVYVGPRRPTSGTHANFKMSVDGKLVVQSIYVIPANDAAWADDVFANNYQLPTLKETEKFIAKHGHLQGIPSAKEIKENGIDLGAMVEKLLRKLEELYLHVIRLEKENEALKKAVLK